MSSDTDEYAQFESDIAAALTEVLAKDGHYGFDLARKPRPPYAAQWTLVGVRETAHLPYSSLMISEKDRETEIRLVPFEEPHEVEHVRGRRGADVRAAIDKVRVRIGLAPLFGGR